MFWDLGKFAQGTHCGNIFLLDDVQTFHASYNWFKSKITKKVLFN